MLIKFSCLRLIIIIINAVVNPALTWADVNKNLKNNMQNRQDTSTSGSGIFNDATNAWQPYIPNHKWLPQPPTFTSTMSKSTLTLTTTTTPLTQTSNYKQHKYTHHNHHNHHNHHTHHTHHQYSTDYGNQENQQLQQQQQQQIQVPEYNGNYQKNHVNMPKLISSQIPPNEINSLTTSIAALKAGTKASHKSNIGNSFNSHEPWLLYNPSNMVNTVHSQVQIPKDIISEVHNSQRSQQWQLQSHPQKKKTSILTQLHLPQVTDIEEKNYQSSQHYHQHASTIWPDTMHPQSKFQINANNVQQKHISFDSLDPYSNVNVDGKTDMKKKNLNDNNILIKASQQNIKTNEISNDSVDVQNHDNDNDATDDDEQFSQPNVLETATTSSHHGDGKYLNLKLTLLKKIFNNNPTLYDNNKDIQVIPCDKKKPESDRSNIGYGNDDDTSYSYSNGDKIDEVNDLINSMPHHLVVKSSSNTTAAATADAAEMEKYDTFNVKDITQPVDEVQGRKTQITKDVMKQAFVSKTPQVMDKTKCTTYSKAMPTPIATQAQRRIWNVLTTPQTRLSSATMDSSTSKSLSSEIVSGRKVRKVKKKLKKFLLPLLLAYKLKFITLLPLLVSGLVLLVGTTGLAGFFFALFLAVMSLKSSGSRNAVVVKKY